METGRRDCHSRAFHTRSRVCSLRPAAFAISHSVKETLSLSGQRSGSARIAFLSLFTVARVPASTRSHRRRPGSSSAPTRVAVALECQSPRVASVWVAHARCADVLTRSEDVTVLRLSALVPGLGFYWGRRYG